MLKNPGQIRTGLIAMSFVGLLSPFSTDAQTAGSVALTGQVSSQQEGPMEGVIVSAKGVGTNITLSVVSDDKGQYKFPSARLKPNKYSISIRAVGYDLRPSLVAEVTSDKPTHLDLKLAKAADLSSQLSNAEWILSAPGTDAQKQAFGGCVNCHTLERIFRSKHDADEFVGVIQRMPTWVEGSTPKHLMKYPDNYPSAHPGAPSPQLKNQAKYFSELNLSAGRTKWDFEFKTLPRPKGEATRVIYTEFALPNPTWQPHDVIVDSSGMVWYDDLGTLSIGRLDPRTGTIKEWKLPPLKPGAPPTGCLSIVFDGEGNMWTGPLTQGGIYKFDPKTEKISSWSAPEQYNNVEVTTAMTAPANSRVDGKVWFTNARANRVVHRVTLATGKVETFNVYGDHKEGHSMYGMASDSQNNAYWADLQGSNIGFVDAKTGHATLYPTPTPHSGPRRMNMDSKNRLWFGENTGNRIGMFDTKSKTMHEWLIPTPWSDSYDAVMDKAGHVWAGGRMTDDVVRLSPETGKMVEYLLPKTTNIRRVFADDTPTKPVFWVGDNLGASIIKVEPLE